MSEQRVFIFNQISPTLKNTQGNIGQIEGRELIARGCPLRPDSSFIASGINALLPGGVIPWHEHANDEEVYIFISGSGFYMDNNQVKHPVKAGDTAFCLKGEKHGLENPGPEPLLFGAVIAK